MQARKYKYKLQPTCRSLEKKIQFVDKKKN